MEPTFGCLGREEDELIRCNTDNIAYEIIRFLQSGKYRKCLKSTILLKNILDYPWVPSRRTKDFNMSMWVVLFIVERAMSKIVVYRVMGGRRCKYLK